MTQQNEVEARIASLLGANTGAWLTVDRANFLARLLYQTGYRLVRPDDLKVLTDTEIADAVADYRRILEMNGHKPNPMDGRKAVAQAQLAADKKALGL